MKTTISNKYRILLILFTGINTICALGQNKVIHEVFASRDGLAIDNILDLRQDHLGYLWIGGENLDSRDIVGISGAIHLQRFDGKNFYDIVANSSAFYGDVKNLTSYKGSQLILHHKNKDTDFKLSLLDTSTFEFTDIPSPDTGDISDVRMIDGLFYAINIAGTTVELYRLDDALEFNFEFSFPNQVNAVATDHRTIFLSHHDMFLFSDDNFPITITDKQGEILKKFSYEGFDNLKDNTSEKLWIENAFIAHDKLYAFMRHDDRLFVLNEENLNFEPLLQDHFKGKIDVNAFVDANGQVVIAYTKNDLLYVATLDEHDTVIPLYHNTYEAQLGIQIWSSNIKDQVWISTGDELHYYKFPNRQFESFLIDKQLRAIQHIGNHDYILATEFNGWYLYNHKDKVTTPFKITENGDPISLNSSRNIIVENDTLWSNNEGSIVAVHKENGGSKSYNYFPAQCIEPLNDSIFIYGTKNLNLMKFNKVTKQHSPLLKTDSLNIFDIALDSKKEWIVAATQKGVLTYHLNSKLSRFYHTGLNNNFFLMVDYHESYGFLLGTRDGQVFKHNPDTGKSTVVYNDELRAGIATITPYNNDLWINTFNGLVQFNPNNKKNRRYSIKDGLSHNEGNRYSAALTDTGIFIGSLLGVNHFVPEQLISQQSQDSLQLLKIRKFDSKLNKFVEIYDQSAFAKAEPIILPVENKSLELGFSLTGLDVLRNESYQYQLNDGEWNELKEERNLQFLNLAAGEYTLKIRAKDFSGSLIGNPLSLSIISQDFFYNTWWFYVVMILTITSLLLWWLKIQRTKNLMQVQFSQDLIQNQEEERSRIAKELHDSVGQHLTLIKQTAQNKKLDDIAGLTNTTLEEIRLISRNIYPANLNLLGFKSSVEQLMEDVDNQTAMFVDIEIDEVDPFLDEKTKLNLYRFIQEAVSNVIKHAHAKTLQIKITANAKHLGVYIMDNGRGFEENTELMNHSLGFKTLKERINIVNGTLEIKTALGKGTELRATIPKN